MAQKVFIHLGLPKTGTTYLQTIMWADRDRMRDQGVLLPGRERRDHLWSSRIIREDPTPSSYPPPAREAWDVVRGQIADWPTTALISHEFFAAASAEQAARMVDALAPAEVHLIITARENVGLFTGGWQESLKNRGTATMAEFAAAEVSDSPQAIWNWRTLDLRLVLERWAPTVPADRVHILPMPRADEPRDLLWRRYATLVGLDADSFDLSTTFTNPSMGVVEAEVLRRVNVHLATPAFDRAFDRGVYIRTYLADERLATRSGEKYWPATAVIGECRERAAAAIDHITSAGYDVIGDLANLRVPDELPPRRLADSATDAEVADVATAVVGRMLHDVRDLRTERADLRRRLDRPTAPGLRAALVERFPWTRALIRRSR